MKELTLPDNVDQIRRVLIKNCPEEWSTEHFRAVLTMMAIFDHGDGANDEFEINWNRKGDKIQISFENKEDACK
jgi:hypothetical protein